ncbi:gamma-glutamyl phosphate reductase [Arthrobacter sp. Hiyo4]|nr:gamma-glutamyl phosphate reductase [Arthrobacter sp. Hiyo4]
MTEALIHNTAAISGDTAAVPAAPEAPASAAVPLSAEDVEAAVHAVADRSKHAARRMASANRAWKDRGLRAIGTALLARKDQILAANAKDVAAGKANGTSAAMLDRLTLTDARITGSLTPWKTLPTCPTP